MKIETRSHSPCCSPCNRCCYDENCISKEKDILISQLKAHIFELELREKDYNILQDRYNQLQHDVACLNDCKNKLECEKKLKDDSFNQSINQLQGENENLQLSLNEKLTSNKNIFTENNVLGKQIEMKNVEICQLNAKINDLNCQLQQNSEDRCNLQKTIDGLNDIKANQGVKIAKLAEDNKTLKDICNNQDCCLKAGAQERAKLNTELEAKNNEIQNLNCQIGQRVNDENNLQNQLNKLNATNAQLQNHIKEQEAQVNGLKCENSNLNSNLIKETQVRVSENQKNNQLTNILNDRDKKIDLLNHDIATIKLMQQNASDRNCLLQDENSKLRNHIMVLTDLNQTLINEIDNVICEDEKMKCILDRKERINNVLNNNRCSIDQSLNCLDQGINRGVNFNCHSPCRPCPVVYEC
jgi:chromosome segregation ATPase